MSLSANRYRDLEKLIAPIRDKFKGFVKARLDNNVSGEKIAVAHAALLDVLNKERQNLTSNPLVMEYFKHIEQVAKKYADAADHEKKFVAIAGIKPLRDPFQREFYWVASLLDREDHAGMRKSYEQGVKNIETKKADILKLPQGAEFVAYLTDNLLVFLDEIIKDTAAHSEAIAKTDQANNQMRSAEDAAKRGDVANASRYWEELGKKVDPVMSTSSWHWFYEVKDFLDRYATLSAKLSDLISDAKAKQEIEDAGRKLKTACSWLKRALDSNNAADASKYGIEVEQYLTPLTSKYADRDTAKSSITEGNAMLQRYRTEIEPLLQETNAKALVEQLKNPLNWLQTSLSQRREDDATKYRELLEPKLNELKAKYASVEMAAKFIQQADGVLAHVNNELGSIITDKQVKAITEKLDPQLTWLDRYLKEKNVSQVQSTVPKVEEMIAQLKRYETHPNAKKSLNNATLLLQRVESELGSIIAAEEIDKSVAALQSPLSSLESSIQRKDVQAILTYQDRVTSLAIPLRKHAGQAKAEATLTRVNALLHRIESEVAQIIAEQSVKKVSHQVRVLITATATLNDPNAAAQNLSKLLYLVHPLRVQYGQFDVVKAVVKQVDDLVAKFKPQLSQAQQQEAQHVMPELEKSFHEIEGKAHSSASLADLKELNKRAFQLKKNMLIDSAVNALMVKIDQLNLKLIGRVPVDEEYLPIFLVNPKSPSQLQNVLTRINDNNALFNKKFIEAKQEIEGLDRCGDECSHYNVCTRALTDPYETRRSWFDEAKRCLDKLDSQLLADLVKVDPAASEIQQLKDAVQMTRKLLADTDAKYALLCRYIQANALAYWLLHGAAGFIPHIQTFTRGQIEVNLHFNYEEVPDDVRLHIGYESHTVPPHVAYIVVTKLLDAAIEAAKAAEQIMPEESLEATECITTATKLKTVVLEGHAQLCQKYIDHYLTHTHDRHWKQMAQIWIDSAKELLGSTPSIAQFEKKLADMAVATAGSLNQ